jgi:Protein of unknown function (DUF3102)
MSEVTTSPAPQRHVAARDDRSTRINTEHEEVKNSLRRGAEHAIKAGHLLLEAKKEVGHGNFLEWIGDNCSFTVSTAGLYMKLAKNEALLQSNSQRIENLTVNDAIGLLKGLRQEFKEPKDSTAKSDQLTTLIKKKGAFAILERAWQIAGEYERADFRRQIAANSPFPSR